jgi:hypothetical protein
LGENPLEDEFSGGRVGQQRIRTRSGLSLVGHSEEDRPLSKDVSNIQVRGLPFEFQPWCLLVEPVVGHRKSG